MNPSARVLRRPRRAWLPDVLIAAAILALVLLAAVACSSGSGPSSAGSGGSPAAGGSAATPSAVGYSHCMRSHGVPNYPDPPSGGQVPKADPQQLGVSTSQLQAAQRSCRHLYPRNGGALGASLRQCEETGNCPQAMVHRVMNSMLAFSRVHARPRGAELARPHRRFRGAPWFQPRPHTRHRLEFAADPKQDLRMRARDARRRRGSSDLPRGARLNSGIPAAPRRWMICVPIHLDFLSCIIRA